MGQNNRVIRYALILLCVLSGASWAIAGSELWVMAQRAAPNSIRGRVNAILLMVAQGALTQGALALGATVLGAIADHLGTPTAFSLAAILLLIGAYIPNFFDLNVSSEPTAAS